MPAQNIKRNIKRKKRKTSLTGRIFSSRKSSLLLVMGLFAVIGGITLWISHAATPNNLHWYLSDQNAAGQAKYNFDFGTAGNVGLACKFVTGSKKPGIAVYENGTWYIRNTATAGNYESSVLFGASGNIPVCGDWDGNGTDTIGVYDHGYWYLKNSNTPGAPDITIHYGGSGDIPVVGKWAAGMAADGIGVYSPLNASDAKWYLRKSVSAGSPDISFSFGTSNYKPVVGDWNGDGVDTVGVYDTFGFKAQNVSHFYLRNSNSAGSPELDIVYGTPSYIPVVGDWDGNGTDTIGVTYGVVPQQPTPTNSGGTPPTAVYDPVSAATITAVCNNNDTNHYPALQVGHTGECVKRMQQLLNVRVAAGLTITGVFDEATRSAVFDGMCSRPEYPRCDVDSGGRPFIYVGDYIWSNLEGVTVHVDLNIVTPFIAADNPSSNQASDDVSTITNTPGSSSPSSGDGSASNSASVQLDASGTCKLWLVRWWNVEVSSWGGLVTDYPEKTDYILYLKLDSVTRSSCDNYDKNLRNSTLSAKTAPQYKPANAHSWNLRYSHADFNTPYTGGPR